MPAGVCSGSQVTLNAQVSRQRGHGAKEGAGLIHMSALGAGGRRGGL